MNRILVSGRVVGTIRTSETKSGLKVFTGRISVPKRVRPETPPFSDYFNFEMFGRRAERAIARMEAGDRVILEGRMQNDVFTAKDGQRVTRDVISVESWEFAENKQDTGDDTEEHAEDSGDRRDD